MNPAHQQQVRSVPVNPPRRDKGAGWRLRVVVTACLALGILLLVAWVSNPGVRIGTVTGSGLRLRAAPSLSGAIISKLQRGDRVRITGVHGEWYAVIRPAQNAGSAARETISGYVYRDYVRLAGPSIVTRHAAFVTDLAGRAWLWLAILGAAALVIDWLTRTRGITLTANEVKRAPSVLVAVVVVPFIFLVTAACFFAAALLAVVLIDLLAGIPVHYGFQLAGVLAIATILFVKRLFGRGRPPEESSEPVVSDKQNAA